MLPVAAQYGLLGGFAAVAAGISAQGLIGFASDVTFNVTASQGSLFPNATLSARATGNVTQPPPSTEPAAVVHWATTRNQRTVIGTLADLPELAEKEKIGAPATVIVGEVVRLAGSLAWFEGRPESVIQASVTS